MNEDKRAELRARLLPGWLGGKTAAEIAHSLGLKPRSVATYISATGLVRDYPRLEPRAVRRLIKEEKLTRLFYEGRSNRSIAAEIGYTTKSVRAKIAQLGLVYSGRRGSSFWSVEIPPMDAEQAAIYNSLLGMDLRQRERYGIAVRSTRRHEPDHEDQDV